MTISAILFDLDGTLVDSLDLTVACFVHACHTHLGTAPSREWIAATMGRPLIEVLEEAAPGHGSALLPLYQDYHVAHHDRLIRPFPQAQEVVRALHAQGMPIGVVTSKRRPGALRALDLYDLTPLLRVLITPEDTARHKPAPDPLLEGARRLGVPPEQILYVGDSTHDVLAAQAAGMPVAAALWGAGRPGALAALAPDVLLHRPGELMQWLDGNRPSAAGAGYSGH